MNKEPSPISLLVVDDDVFVRTSLSRRLRRDGFLVCELSSGESLLEYLNSNPVSPDAIIIDYKMMGMNGLEAYQSILPRFPHIPVILLTAYPGVVDEKEAKRLGIFEILTKKVDLDSLQLVIAEAVNGKQE